MRVSPTTRLFGIVVLAGVLFGLLVWFGSLSPAPTAGDYFGADELAQDYDRYVGRRVVVGGTVLQTDPIVIAAEPEVQSTLRLRITNVSQPVSEGERLSVFGIARQNQTIHALNTQVTPQRGFWYAYLVSFLAGFWVLSRLLRQWRIDWQAMAIERRPSPITWRSFLAALRRSPREDDPNA